MALQDQCTPDSPDPFRVSPFVVMIPLGFFEALLSRLKGLPFKVATFLLYRAACVNYYEPAWVTLADVAAGTNEEASAVCRALAYLCQAGVASTDTLDGQTVYRFNNTVHPPGEDAREPEGLARRAPPPTQRFIDRLVERDGEGCLACGRTDVPLEIDHIVPRSRGGSDAFPNRQLLCGPCNRSKGARTIDYRPASAQGHSHG